MTGSLSLEGITCEQLANICVNGTCTESPISKALTGTLYKGTGVPASSNIVPKPDCEERRSIRPDGSVVYNIPPGRRAMQLVLQFKLTVSSDAFGSAAVGSLGSSVGDGSFGDGFSAEALKRGETAFMSASGFSGGVGESAAIGVLPTLLHVFVCTFRTNSLTTVRGFQLAFPQTLRLIRHTISQHSCNCLWR